MNNNSSQKSNLLDQLNDIPKFQKILMAVIILVGIVLVWYFSYFNTLFAKSSKLEKKITQLNKFKQELPLEIKGYANVGKKLKLYKQMLPEKEEIPTLLVTIHSTISNIGLTMNKFSPIMPTQKPKGSYIVVPIQVSAVGSFDQIGNAFESIAKLTRLVKITGFTIAESNKNNLLNVDFNAETYTLNKANLAPKESKK